MKLFSINRILAAGALTGAMVFSLPVSADDGVLNFSGSVVNAPCNLSMEQANQTVDLGQHKSEQVNASFSITFTDCTTSPAKISWTGEALDPFSLLTSTTGLVLKIYEGETPQFIDGTQNELPNFVDGDNTVNFKVWTRSGDWTSVAEGPYTASAQFTMHYE